MSLARVPLSRVVCQASQRVSRPPWAAPFRLVSLGFAVFRLDLVDIARLRSGLLGFVRLRFVFAWLRLVAFGSLDFG